MPPRARAAAAPSHPRRVASTVFASSALYALSFDSFVDSHGTRGRRRDGDEHCTDTLRFDLRDRERRKRAAVRRTIARVDDVRRQAAVTPLSLPGTKEGGTSARRPFRMCTRRGHARSQLATCWPRAAHKTLRSSARGACSSFYTPRWASSLLTLPQASRRHGHTSR